MARARGSHKLQAVRARAKRDGWLDMIRSEADERAALDGYYFSHGRADHVCQFGPRCLSLVGEYDGKPFELMEWQREQLFRPLFGWVKDSQEWGKTVRRFRRAYVQVPKKNGKSPTGAYVGLYMLYADGPNSRGAEVYSASTDKEQAAVVHRSAMQMVEASRELSKRLRLNATTGRIVYPSKHSFYRVLSAAPKRNEGWNAHCIIADELHKWHGRELWDALKWAFASRSEPLLFAITTAGDDTESVCYEQYEYGQRVLRGEQYDPAFFPLIFEADHDDDPDDIETWKKANPSLGAALKMENFENDYNEAKALSRAAFEKWKQLRLDMWLTGSAPWLDARKWDAGERAREKHASQLAAYRLSPKPTEPPPPKRIDCRLPKPEKLVGGPSWGALDLALVEDLSAFALCFPETSHRFRFVFRFWLPEDAAEPDVNKQGTPYKEWAEAGWLTLTPGGETDFDRIEKDIAELAERHDMQQLGYDPMFAAQFTQRLETEHAIERVEFPQTKAVFATPCAEFERMLKKKQLRHSGNQVAAWCIRNVHAVLDDNGRPLRPIKQKKGSAKKIDGAVVAIMAHALAQAGHMKRASFYDTNDPEFV